MARRRHAPRGERRSVEFGRILALVLFFSASNTLPALAQQSGVYRDPACGLDGGAISEQRPKPMAVQCVGSNRFAATFPGDVWSMAFDYDPCGGLSMTAESLVEGISFPPSSQEMTVLWRSLDSLSLVAQASFAGVEIDTQDGSVTVAEHSDFGVLLVELDLATPDAKVDHLGGDSPSLSVIDGLEREVLRSFLKVGFVECSPAG